MAQLGYVTIGTNDLSRATAFYDALLGAIGGKRAFPTPNGQLYAVGKGPMIMVTKPFDGAAATAGNGAMVAIAVDTKEDVAAVHAKALELGGACEGPPGPRGSFGEFAYFRDPDGNKLCAFKSGG